MHDTWEEMEVAVPEYWGWGLLAPALLSLLYGFTAHYAMGSMGYTQKNTLWERVRLSLPSILLFTGWGIVNIPLTALYILAFLCKLFRLLNRGGSRTRALFLINLTHLMTMALHMIIIGIIAISTATPPYEFLQNPFWRIATICMVLAVDNITACLLPHWNILFEVLRTRLDREEVRPFMVFLWFGNICLLLDSVLCMSGTDWSLMPLLLISSTVLMEFYLIRFLHHLYMVLKAQYLEEEHRRLKAELEQQNETAERLRNKSERDSLTGIFSRRYGMEQAELLLRKKLPFSLIYIDLDHLKAVNDREGHQAGDCYLIRFAETLGASLREHDVFARIGGDEFIILLPDCKQETAVKRMEDIRARSEFPPFSYGVTFVSGDSNVTLEETLQKADMAMYRDKKARTQ